VETALGDLDRAASYRLLLKNRFPDSREAQGLN
jgi:Tfp pilus assembly protein PilF